MSNHNPNSIHDTPNIISFGAEINRKKVSNHNLQICSNSQRGSEMELCPRVYPHCAVFVNISHDRPVISHDIDKKKSKREIKKKKSRSSKKKIDKRIIALDCRVGRRVGRL